MCLLAKRVFILYDYAMREASLHAFLTWKASKEIESNSRYSQHCSTQISLTTRRWYYYCNRSGQYTPKGEGKRNLKIQGTSKIGYNCTAHIKATENTESGDITVEYCDSHSHPIQLGHIPIPEDARMLIARKLGEGVTIDKILDDIRDNVGSAIKRQHLINRQDINNIKRQFNIAGIERHHEDQLSVCAWINELQSLEYNPITFFKEQGSEGNDMSKEDFILAIQTKFQCDMMKAFGTNLICMDATHGTNHYHFKLVTVLVLHDFGEGVPVGWMISNKEDGIVLRIFLLSEAQLLAKNSTSCDMMKAGITHLKHAVNTMKAIEPAIATETLVPAVSIAPNKKSEHQPRFHQTGKKRASDRNQSLSKPTLPEIDQCLQSLTHETVRVCGACFQEENKGSSSEFVEWIQCTKCSIWLHATCTNHQPMVTSDSPSTRIANDFICIYCSEV